jgi:hypothetical protein
MIAARARALAFGASAALWGGASAAAEGAVPPAAEAPAATADDAAAEPGADDVGASEAAPLPAQADKLTAVLGWSVNVPLGSVRDFATNTSPVGAELQLQYRVAPQLAVGVSGEWVSFVDVRPRATYSVDGAALTATAYNNLVTATVRLLAAYYLATHGSVLPYVAPHVGVSWSSYRSRTADLELDKGAVSIAYGVEAGVLVPMLDGPIFVFHLRYTALPASEFRDAVGNVQMLGLLAGVGF